MHSIREMTSHEPEPAPLDYAPARARPTWIYFGSWWSALLLILGPLLALIAAMVIPGITRTRECQRAVRCAARLHAIGAALEAYAHTNGGCCPSDLDVLVAQGFVAADYLSCPSADPGSVRPAYIYIAGQERGKHDGNVAVHESPSNHSGRVANVLFIGGSVRQLDPAGLEAAIAATRARLAQPTTRAVN